MKTFKVEVGNDLSGDTLTIEAETVEAAWDDASRQIADNPGWTVHAAYELVQGSSPALPES